VTVPDHVPPKKVETAPGAAPVEVRHVARAEDPREGTEADDRVLTLLVGVLHAVRKEAFNPRRLPEILPVVGRDSLNRILGGNIAVEVEDLVSNWTMPTAVIGNPFGVMAGLTQS